MHRDLIDLIADYEGGPNRQDKNALTDRFCELCFSGAAELGSDELGHVFGILYALIGDVEQHIRGKLATFLAARDDVPHDLILMLANDEIEVSLPIRLSPTPTICSVSPWTAGKGRRRRIEEAIRLILDCSENRTGV